MGRKNTMIAGTGVDIIEIARLENPGGLHFITRCFTEQEQAYMAGRGAKTAAGLFAAKEAVVKALGVGFLSGKKGFWPRDVEIMHDGRGQPFVRLHGEAVNAAKRLRVTRITVSISHNQTTAVAMAVAERTEERHAGRYRRANARPGRLCR